MTAMDDVLAAVVDARERLIEALDKLRQVRSQPLAVETLTTMVGDLAGLRNDWERERDRWREVIPASEATLTTLAENPQATVELSEAQQSYLARGCQEYVGD